MNPILLSVHTTLCCIVGLAFAGAMAYILYENMTWDRKPKPKKGDAAAPKTMIRSKTTEKMLPRNHSDANGKALLSKSGKGRKA